MKWIEAIEQPPPQPGRKTKIWLVYKKEGGQLGSISWYSQWRRYCFFPHMGTLYEQDCLRDIADFIERETREHKEKGKCLTNTPPSTG